MTCDEEIDVNEDPMRDTQFEDVWAVGMLIAGKGDVKVVDAGDRMGDGYKCSVRSRTHPSLCCDVGISVRKGWTCKCDMYTTGSKICAHSGLVYTSVGRFYRVKS